MCSRPLFYIIHTQGRGYRAAINKHTQVQEMGVCVIRLICHLKKRESNYKLRYPDTEVYTYTRDAYTWTYERWGKTNVVSFINGCLDKLIHLSRTWVTNSQYWCSMLHMSVPVILWEQLWPILLSFFAASQMSSCVFFIPLSSCRLFSFLSVLLSFPLILFECFVCFPLFFLWLWPPCIWLCHGHCSWFSYKFVMGTKNELEWWK